MPRRKAPKSKLPSHRTLQLWRFPRGLHEDFKRACHKNGSTMRAVVMAFASRYVSKES